MYIVDAHSLIFQVFHAIPEMSSPSGLPTNAIFGFTRDLLFLRERQPEFLLCAFDRSEPTFRDKLYPAYKAQRAPMPDELHTQIPLIHQLLEAMRIPVLSAAGYEADDVIATVARAASARGIDVFVCTSDKDCRQLIDDRVRLFNLRKKEVLDRDALQKDWCITPEQVVDLQAMVGDSVDNVPGVPGVGLKTAAKLLQQFGTLDNVLANVDRVSGAKVQQSLRDAYEKVRLSRDLVRLASDVPIEPEWEGWRLRPMDASRLRALFQEWGFHRFADQMRALEREGSAGQRELFSELPGEEKPGNGAVPVGRARWRAAYQLVNTPAKFQSFLTELGRQKRIAVDLETTGLAPMRAEIVGYAFSWKDGEGWYVAVRGPADEPVLDPTEALEQLRPVLENPHVEKVNQDIKYDLLILRNHGVTLQGVAGDPMVADYLLHAGERSHNLDDLGNRYLDHQVIPITDLIGKRGKKQLPIGEVPTARVADYAGEVADVAWRLSGILEHQLKEQGLDKLYRELEVPLIEVLADLEFNGIRLDIPALRGLSAEMVAQLADIEDRIHKLAGRAFNIASPRQLRQVLFDELKLPTHRRTGITGEASTNQETLERLADLGHELPKKILEHRQLAKLRGTYVDALPDLVNPRTGRVHASFNQTVAATGRLSSSDPNLQNIPVRRELGRQIRQAFLPAAGWTLLTADYSQIELRLLAHFTGDPDLKRAFAEDRDIHASVAAQVFGVPEKEVTADQRRMAKTVNFGVVYGISPRGLGARLGMSWDEAARFIDAYFARYPKIAQYQKRLLDRCRRDHYVGTILGRRREITGIRPGSTYQQRNQAEREAINMELQGSAADLIKMAMLNIHRRIRVEGLRARMLLQIHDELVFEVHPSDLKRAATLVNQEMTTALPLDVPIKVDLAAGPNWLDVEELRL
jgi:DNA polymerase-1